MQEAAKRDNKRKIFQGVVTSDKMDKTRVVKVDWAKKHRKYHKIVQQATKFKAHDEKNESRIGDTVRIQETRRLSKDKRWVITAIIAKSEE